MAGSAGEIITLQLGHYSNFVGSHFWNAQELTFVYDNKEPGKEFLKEINHDVLFREGQTLKGDITYTPRLIAVDLKGSLHTLRKEGILYEVSVDEDDTEWTNDITLHKTASHPKNDFLRDLEREEAKLLSKDGELPQASLDNEDLDESKDNDKVHSSSKKAEEQVFGKRLYNLDEQVNVWSDFLRAHLHPRTLCVVEDYRHEDEYSPFNVFGYGSSILENKKFRNEFEDSLHFFVEECDHLQGFQIVVDTYDGFGGLGSQIVQELEDDFSTKAIFTTGVSPASFTQTSHSQNIDCLINSLLTMDKLSSHSSLLLPLSLATSLWRAPGASVKLPHLDYKSDLLYHTSAILGASLETLTLPWRQESRPVPLSQIMDVIGVRGRKLACLQSSFPMPIHEQANLMSALINLEDQLPWQPMTPYSCERAKVYAQAVTVRGIPQNRVKSATPNPKMPRILQNCSTVDEVWQFYLTEVFPSALNASCSLQSPSPVGAPFPHIFNDSISTEGFVSDIPRKGDIHGVESVPMVTSLQSSASSGLLLEHLHKEASKINIKKYHKYLETGTEVDDYKESLDSIAALQSNYELS